MQVVLHNVGNKFKIVLDNLTENNVISLIRAFHTEAVLGENGRMRRTKEDLQYQLNLCRKRKEQEDEQDQTADRSGAGEV